MLTQHSTIANGSKGDNQRQDGRSNRFARRQQANRRGLIRTCVSMGWKDCMWSAGGSGCAGFSGANDSAYCLANAA